MSSSASSSYSTLQTGEPSTEDKVWTSVGACMFAISTLVNAGLAMVLLVNVRPGHYYQHRDNHHHDSSEVSVTRRNGHTGFTPFLLITLSNLATNILDSLLLLLAAGLRPDTTGGQRIDTSELLDKPECHSLQRWMVAVDLSLPMKLCCQVMTNLLAVGAFLYTSEHEDIHIKKPRSKNSSTDPILELSQMSRKRVITLIAICWLLPLVLMWHPMLINCLEDRVALQLVLYGWMAYMLWAMSTIAVVTVDRGMQHGLNWYILGRRKPVDHLVDSTPIENRLTSMYTYMAYYKVRHESTAMLFLLVLGAGTTLPWPLAELFHIFRHERGAKPRTQSLISLRLVLQVLPYIYYMVQPVALILGFHRIRKRLRFHRSPSTEAPIQLVPSNSADPSTRLVPSSTEHSMHMVNSTCIVDGD